MVMLHLTNELFKRNKFRKILIYLSFFSIFLGVIVVPFEVAVPGSTINNMGDGLWWAVTTVTTVGYGDVVPITTLGRLVGTILQLLGVMMYGSLIGIVTVYMNRNQSEYNWQRMFARIDQLEKEIKSLRKETSFIVKNEENIE